MTNTTSRTVRAPRSDTLQALPADRIRNLKIQIWQAWEEQFKEAMAPDFSGTIGIEVRVERGIIKGFPRVLREKCISVD